MNKKKKREDDVMQAQVLKPKNINLSRKDRIHASFEKIVKTNGEALKKLSKN